MANKRSIVLVPQVPPQEYCDFSCLYATFAPKDAVGDCRKEQAVYCTFLARFNNKNNRCIVPRKTDRHRISAPVVEQTRRKRTF